MAMNMKAIIIYLSYTYLLAPGIRQCVRDVRMCTPPCHDAATPRLVKKLASATLQPIKLEFGKFYGML